MALTWQEPIDYTWEEGRDSHQFSDVEMHEPREIHFVEFKTQQSGKQNETVGKTKPIQKENIMEPALDRMSQHSEGTVDYAKFGTLLNSDKSHFHNSLTPYVK